MSEVHEILEKMVPELRHLQKLKVLDAAEIKTVVSQRRRFEFLLRARTPELQSFLRYIEYEVNFRGLCQERIKALTDVDALAKKGASDFASYRRIHFIFKRALMRFDDQPTLWLDYVAWCRSIQAHKKCSEALVSAIRLHPLNRDLWLASIAFQAEVKSDPKAARLLLMQALRNLDSDPKLFQAFFQLEVAAIQNLEAARKLDAPDEQQEQEEPDSAAAETSAAIGAHVRALDAVHRHARQRLGDNVLGRLALWTALPAHLSALQPVRTAVVLALREDFPDDGAVAAAARQTLAAAGAGGAISGSAAADSEGVMSLAVAEPPVGAAADAAGSQAAASSDVAAAGRDLPKLSDLVSHKSDFRKTYRGSSFRVETASSSISRLDKLSVDLSSESKVDAMVRENAAPAKLAAKRNLKRRRARQNPSDTAGAKWGDLKRVDKDDAAARDFFSLVSHRQALDPKHHFRKMDKKERMPEFAEIGTIVDAPADYYASQRPTKRMRRDNAIDQVLVQTEQKAALQRRFQRIREARNPRRNSIFWKKKPKGRYHAPSTADQGDARKKRARQAKDSLTS